VPCKCTNCSTRTCSPSSTVLYGTTDQRLT
jgi:hypothetical protein